MAYAYADNRIIDYAWPYVTTVFSASNYCGNHGNRAAVMIFYEDDIQVCTYVSEGGWCVCYIVRVTSDKRLPKTIP